jgi:E3 ubiquitin-protein ligase HUWE1
MVVDPFRDLRLISVQEMDDGHYSENEDMDEEDEDQDVEMDYGEETGSEDTSASESDGEQDDLDQVTQGSGAVWDEADEEDEEDLVENEDVDDGGDDEHDEDDENEGEEAEDEEDAEGMMWEVRFFDLLCEKFNRMVWQDMQEEVEGLGMALENAGEPTGHGGDKLLCSLSQKFDD